MISSTLTVSVAAAYLCVLFAIAFVTDQRSARGQARFIASPWVYTLSLSVYCTSWTFYGAVGFAARDGLEFLTIYLGPSLVFIGWWLLLRKLVHVSRAQRITSIADFISARYGKSPAIAATVTLMAVIMSVPYVSLQLIAVAASFEVLTLPAEGGPPADPDLLSDTGFWVMLSMTAFVIAFGTRRLGADTSHPGVVAAIALEALVKLVALLAVGLFAVFGVKGGLGAVFDQAMADPALAHLYHFQPGYEARWVTTLLLATLAAVCLPRQFQVTVVENADPRHLATAAWLFPLYLLLISLFAIPIAIVGLTTPGLGDNPDLYVLTVPLVAGRSDLALLAFIGGLSAATSMVIVASLTLSIMISNHLVSPLLLRSRMFGPGGGNVSGALLLSRRVSIFAILLLALLYYRATTADNGLAAIGLISFAGVAQFAPALLAGVFWARATRPAAMAGLLLGFATWAYTLLLPTLATAGWGMAPWLPAPGSGGLWDPYALLGLVGWDPLVHGTFWSLSLNSAALIALSLMTRLTPLERLQAALFVSPGQGGAAAAMDGILQRSASTQDLLRLTQRILGPQRAYDIFRNYARRQGRADHLPDPDPTLVAHVERQLASNIGAASARSLVSDIVKGETISLEQLIALLDETQQVLRTSAALERKSRELEETAAQLRAANAQLTQLDKLKDSFLSRISHELRTPMTSIRSISEILTDRDGLGAQVDAAQRARFLTIIHGESERLTRLLNDILDLSRLESDDYRLPSVPVDAADVVHRAVETMAGLARCGGQRIAVEIGSAPLWVAGDRDRLTQVVINLLSNALHYGCPRRDGKAGPDILLRRLANNDAGLHEIAVIDWGPGVPHGLREQIFSKFSRGWRDHDGGERHGSGLGLAISRQIMRQLGGDLRLETTTNETGNGSGATFVLSLVPAAAPSIVEAAR